MPQAFRVYKITVYRLKLTWNISSKYLSINLYHLYLWLTTVCAHMQISSVEFSSSVESNTLWHHGLQHARLPVHPNSWSLLKLTSTKSVIPSIQLSHPLLSPSPLTFNLSKHQSLFKWFSSSHQVVKVLEFLFSFSISPSNEHSRLTFRIDWLNLLAVKGTLRVFSNTSVQKHQFFGTQLSL